MTSVGRLFLGISPQAPETHRNPEERGLLKTAHSHSIFILQYKYYQNTQKALQETIIVLLYY